MTDKELLKLEIKNRMNADVGIPYIDIKIDHYTSPYDLKNAISSAIASALNELKHDIISSIVDEMYSDEKFESDIGLR